VRYLAVELEDSPSSSKKGIDAIRGGGPIKAFDLSQDQKEEVKKAPPPPPPS